jgi:hypothetical protein
MDLPLEQQELDLQQPEEEVVGESLILGSKQLL